MSAYLRVRKLISAAAIVSGSLLAHAPVWADETLQVDSIRLGSHDAQTRFVLDLSEKVKPRIFTLSEPYRVVVDLPAATFKIPRENGEDGRGLVKGYRYGLFRPGNSRLVIDMAGPGKVAKVFSLAPGDGKGHRLVIDLEPVSHDLFLASAGWPKDGSAPSRGESVPLRKPSSEPKREKYVIAIDAGHGGIDPGAIGRSGLQEKSITLSVASKLKKQLQATGNYDVIMVREGDIFHSLRDRVTIARKAKADLFISLHADTIKNRSVRGAAVYTLSDTASDKEAGELASKENRADIIAGVDTSDVSTDVSMILIELSMREAKNRSAHFAQVLMPELGKETKLLRNTHRFAGFRVLKAPDVPSVLIELGYMSNAQDEKNLRSKDWQRRVAGSIGRGIDAYFKSAENGQMRQAMLQ